MQGKVNALKQLDKDEQLKPIADEYGVKISISIVSEWRKNRNKIEKCSSVVTSPACIRKCKC